jgi:hypothetical protein
MADAEEVFARMRSAEEVAKIYIDVFTEVLKAR